MHEVEELWVILNSLKQEADVPTRGMGGIEEV